MLRRRKFGDLPDGTSVDVITLGDPAGPGGIEARVLTYGCIIASLTVPDAHGVAANVVLGFDRFEPYVDSSPYFGAVVGRYANRIAHARFAIDGREHRVTANEPPHHLHGGFSGFDKRDMGGGTLRQWTRRRLPPDERRRRRRLSRSDRRAGELHRGQSRFPD